VDGRGAIIAASMHEGMTPETIDQVLPAGTYMLYVHVDPARPFDADNPYQLTLSLSQLDTVEAPPTDDGPAAGNVPPN
jgi:hypothetical protein